LRNLVVFLCAFFLGFSADAQEKPVKKKPVAKKQAVHKKPTPEQIRKFNQLQKQREAKG
jgi:hypothetical protein